MYEKFGKPLIDILKIKNVFIDKEDEFEKENQRINKIYSQQPKRTNCMNCSEPIGHIDFRKQGIDYSICKNCTHLNGIYQDTDNFCNAVYADSDQSYSANYDSMTKDEFYDRVKKVYFPKIEFLNTSLKNKNVDISNLSLTDFGAGNGYFVAAALESNFKNVYGYEVSNNCVNFANEMFGSKILKPFSIPKTLDVIKNVDTEILSMIGVLEHLQHPREVLKQINLNNSIEYLYLSVPVFGLSVYLELLFPEMMHRQLSRDHTHLYTKESLEWTAKNLNMEVVSTWWFGQEMLDLYRFGSLVLSKESNISSKWQSIFLKIIDRLQLEIDKEYLSSEVHILFKKN